MAGLKKTGRRTAAAAQRKLAKVEGPSPNPMTNMLISDIAMRGGGALMKHLVERAVLGAKYDRKMAKDIVKGRSMTQTLIGTALARFATRSVPGALVVGGGLLAKTLYDRTRNEREARVKGEKKIAKQARRG